MSKLRIGEIYRYARPYNSTQSEIDGLPNFFFRTKTADSTMATLERGISSLSRTGAGRLPAILISSSPHKVGSENTPWQDNFDPDIGHIRYFGDNKAPGTDPATASGNKALLTLFVQHHSSSQQVRASAAPLLFFKRVRVDGRAKGNVVFEGFGLVERAEKVVQPDPASGQNFANYRFDFTVLSLVDEGDELDWNWIGARRDPAVSDADCLALAPASWKHWVKHGATAIERNRRRVSKLLVIPVGQQRPPPGSREAKTLNAIYDFYKGKKARFEAVALFVAEKILQSSGAFRPGWITPPSSDGGSDFVARLDIGSGLATVKMVVLGQAKCEKLTTATGGTHIARTVARLRRGWVGVYATTSYFSEPVQREVIEDKYPILMVDGLRLAQELDQAAMTSGYKDVTSLLTWIDSTYDSLVASRNAEEILLD